MLITRSRAKGDSCKSQECENSQLLYEGNILPSIDKINPWTDDDTKKDKCETANLSNVPRILTPTSRKRPLIKKKCSKSSLIVRKSRSIRLPKTKASDMCRVSTASTTPRSSPSSSSGFSSPEASDTDLSANLCFSGPMPPRRYYVREKRIVDDNTAYFRSRIPKIALARIARSGGRKKNKYISYGSGKMIYRNAKIRRVPLIENIYAKDHFYTHSIISSSSSSSSSSFSSSSRNNIKSVGSSSTTTTALIPRMSSVGVSSTKKTNSCSSSSSSSSSRRVSSIVCKRVVKEKKASASSRPKKKVCRVKQKCLLSVSSSNVPSSVIVNNNKHNNDNNSSTTSRKRMKGSSVCCNAGAISFKKMSKKTSLSSSSSSSFQKETIVSAALRKAISTARRILSGGIEMM